MAYSKYTGKELFMNVDDVETQKFPWGTLEWLSEPRTTGTNNMTAGIVTLLPGSGHSTHRHNGADEILYAIDGSDCEQYIIYEDGTRVSQVMNAGDMVHIPADLDHGTVNRGKEPMHMFAVYQYPGSEDELGALPECTIVPPKH